MGARLTRNGRNVLAVVDIHATTTTRDILAVTMTAPNGGLSSAWRAALTAWVMHLRAAGHPETTIGTRLENVSRFARHSDVADPWEVTGHDLIAWFSLQEWAPETRRGMRNSMLSFYRWGVAGGAIDDNPAEELPRVKPTAASARPIPMPLYRQGMAVADERTRLILRMAAEAGLRRTEIALIHRRDITQEADGWSLLVHGKGRKERIMPLSAGLAATLVARAGDGYVFPGDDHGHLSPRYVGKLASQVLPDGWTLHTLRHAFGTRAYALERDVFAVQELLGHASPATTRRYVKLPDDTKRRHIEALGEERPFGMVS